MRRWSAWVAGAAAVALAGTLAVLQMGARAASHAITDHVVHGVITIDGARPGPAFQGVGAISGGGGNSRLLIDYPPAQRNQVLDYLFKPGYGASLQILKLEIGGDAYATDGAEPSFEHARHSINCGAGYELWLAQQARMRNPAIQLVALQWNAPRWVGGATGNPWSLTDIGYIIDWLHCASKDGLSINYIGGWNEHLPHGITGQVMGWFVRLRHTLDKTGYRRVRIIGVDSFAHLHSGRDVSDFLAGHPAFRAAIGVLGYHNLCKYPATGNNCEVTHAASASGKPIWESEIGALRQGTGIGAMTRSIDNAFIEVKATGLLAWPLMGSMPANLPEEDRGLVFADEPWSGQYRVNPMTWVIAQTTQFTQTGWRHILGADGQLGSNFGSYAAYEAPSHSAWTLVVQTSNAPRGQTISVHVNHGLPRTVVHVWSTNIKSRSSRSWFVRHGDVHPSGGQFRYTLRSGFIYTFTTVAQPGKGSAVPPASKPMPLPYIAKPDPSNEPRYLGAEDGAFEYLADGKTFEQTAAGAPIFWQNPVSSRFPYAVVGDPSWRNYRVSVCVSFTGAGQSAGLISRFDHPKANGVAERFDGYQFIVSASGAWKLLKDEPRKPPRTLRTGHLRAAPGVGKWTLLSLSVQGSQLVGTVSGAQVVSIRDSTYTSGDAGVSTGGWYPVKFQGLTVTRK